MGSYYNSLVSSIESHLPIAFISTFLMERLHCCFVIEIMACSDFLNRRELGTFHHYYISWKGGVIERIGVRLSLQLCKKQSPYLFHAFSSLVPLFFVRFVFVSRCLNRGWRIVFQISQIGFGTG